MSQKFSLAQQIEEVTRELKQRASVYPRLVGKGSLRQAEADFLVARMQAVKAAGVAAGERGGGARVRRGEREMIYAQV